MCGPADRVVVVQALAVMSPSPAIGDVALLSWMSLTEPAQGIVHSLCRWKRSVKWRWGVGGEEISLPLSFTGAGPAEIVGLAVVQLQLAVIQLSRPAGRVGVSLGAGVRSIALRIQSGRFSTFGIVPGAARWWCRRQSDVLDAAAGGDHGGLEACSGPLKPELRSMGVLLAPTSPANREDLLALAATG